MLQSLLDNMPHGSGIDNSWSFQICRNSVRLYNVYHCMTDGVYNGYARFVIIVSKDRLLCEMNHHSIANSFKLQFLGQRSQYLAKKYFLRDYLEDIFSNYFQELAERGL